MGYPWLKREKRFLRACLDRGKPLLGVCLGAQLLADALGGPVTRNPETEIGWFPVRLTPQGRAWPALANLPDSFIAFHWHGDTFAIPQGGECLAASDACPAQMFRHGDNVLGLQCHLDYTPASIEAMLDHCADEIIPGKPYVQNAETIRAGLEHAQALQMQLYALLDQWLGAG